MIYFIKEASIYQVQSRFTVIELSALAEPSRAEQLIDCPIVHLP